MNSSVTKIPCNLESFFKYWLLFTAPLHKLPPKDINTLSVILRKRFELSRVVMDEELVDSYLFSRDVKKQILEELQEKPNGYALTLSRMRKKGIILEGNKINKRFIPNFKGDRFDLMIIFEVTQED